MCITRQRVACAIRALRYAHTCLGAEDKIETYRPGGIPWHVVASKFDLYTRINMSGALKDEPRIPPPAPCF